MMRGLMDEHARGMSEPIEASAGSSDLLVSTFSAQPFVQSVSEKAGVPYLNALLQPQHPTQSGAASMTPAAAGLRAGKSTLVVPQLPTSRSGDAGSTSWEQA